MTNEQFCSNALTLLGKPYSEIDCIGVIRRSAGISCKGTNWLWRSFKNASKYKYLTERYEGEIPSNKIQDGILVFRLNFNEIPKGYDDKPNCYHVGILYENSVIQSNPATGVYISGFDKTKWNGWGKLKQVDYTAIKPQNTNALTDHDMLLAIYKKLFDLE